MEPLTFSDDFLWGVATSAHQIEGGAQDDGRGESIWDRFARKDGHIADSSDARVACDHYHRWREDVEQMRWLGVGAYRFSIAWPRVLPKGTGMVNTAGLDFYERLVDALLEARIQPFVTLYHWDLPQTLQDKGGWAARDIVEAFVDYAATVSARLGDRVSHWATHNEPWCIATLGHEKGEHAPGHRDPTEALCVAHHLLLSHGRAVDVLRENAPRSEIGIVLNLTPAWAASQSVEDLDAVRQFDGAFNRWYLDPIFRGEYPHDAIEDRARHGHLRTADLPFVRSGDLENISKPLDFLGLNYYTRVVLKAGSNHVPRVVSQVPESALTDMGWEVFPQGMHGLLVRLHHDYGIQNIYVTENGAAYADGPDENGHVDDRRRIEYMHGHLQAAWRAIRAGVPLRGYFAWSLLDNFEWAHGYTKRFGLVWVDYTTQKRIPKRSAAWYRDVIQANALQADAPTLTSRRFP